MGQGATVQSMRRSIIVFYLCFAVVLVSGDDFLYGKFPDGFVWSSATSSYQIEGGWNADGKGVNIWDTFTHAGGHVANNDTGDVACDSYHKYEEDVKLLKNLGVKFYRFSLSWSRILPDGTKNSVSSAGVEYYNKLIKALLDNGIKPFVTLYHWDLPQPLQDIGGWENETLVDYFRDYAEVCFDKFGDRVKWWLTFNEPFVVCFLGYGIGVHAPGIKRSGTSDYNCAHTIIKAHTKAYHLYKTMFKPIQKGVISITLNSDFKAPKDANNQSDVDAAERVMQFTLGWFANPIYGNGDYPDVMKKYVGDKSTAQGFNKSRLPEFSGQEILDNKGTFDFFGLNHYTSRYVTNFNRPINDTSYGGDQNAEESEDETWLASGSAWLKVVPWGLRKLLVWIKTHYNNPAVYITENGVSDRNGSLDDQHRIHYYKSYINEVLKAINKDKCDVKGYTAWSLMDNFEWAEGYVEHFGMHLVNFSDPDRKRTPKASALYYASIIKENGFKDPSPTSSSVTLTFSIMSICFSIFGTIFLV